jgi:periplasmic copper chaperone A
MRRLILALMLFASPAAAHDGVHVNAAYAVVAPGLGQSASVYMAITNHAAAEDRLTGVTTPAAEMAMLHSSTETADGMVTMGEVADGFALAPESTRAFEQGGDHIMLMGLTTPLAPGDEITLTLTFARGEVIDVTVPVVAAGEGAPMADHDH